MLLAVDSQLPCSVVDISSVLEILWLVVQATPHKILLGVCYRPPHAGYDFCLELSTVIHNLLVVHPKADILLFGNFNFPQIDWNDLTSVALSGQAEARKFADLCLNINLTQLVTEPTRVTQECSSILDLILAIKPESLSFIHYLPEISDHKVILATFAHTIRKRETYKKSVRLYDKGDYEKINEELRHFFPVFEATFS